MWSQRKRWISRTALAAVSVATTAFALTGNTSPSRLVLQSSTIPDGQPVAFSLEAKPVRGLHPGAVRHLKLVISNAYPFDLRIDHIQGRLTGTDDPRCQPVASNLVVEPYRGELPVTAPASQRLPVATIPLFMPNTVANACQGVTFTIALSGDATQVTG